MEMGTFFAELGKRLNMNGGGKEILMNLLVCPHDEEI